MLKIFTLFLIVIAVLAMFGKLGWIGKVARKGLQRDRKAGLPKPALCPDCGRHIIGSTGCACRTPSKKG